MANEGFLHVKYTRALRDYSTGFALYHPRPSEDLTPGTCGHFNGDGIWQTLFHLEDIPQDGKFTPLGSIPKIDPINHSWGPRPSTTMQQVSITARAQATGAAGPVNVGGGFNYAFKNESDTGAILLTENPVVERSLEFEDPYDQWCKHNAKHLVETWPDIKKFGFCIIKSTFSTTKWALKASTNKDELVTFAMNAMVQRAAEAEASIMWQETKQLGGWQYSPDDDTPQSFLQQWLPWFVPPAPQRSWVVSVNGLWYNYSKVAKFTGQTPLRGKKRPGTFGPSDSENAGLTLQGFDSYLTDWIESVETSPEI